jgi:ribosomal-protein-alanine N-acetyltransferase
LSIGASTATAGWCGLQFLPETAEVEVAYLLGPSHWGRGLATEAAKASLEYGFEQVALDQIVALVHPDNRASQRVIEKLEMPFVNVAEYFGITVRRYLMERSEYHAARLACAGQTAIGPTPGD